MMRWPARFGEELTRRGVALDDESNRHSHIALISEWDTLYGRALPDTMARCLEQSPCEPVGDDPFRDKNWLHPFKYFRGLDGQMPNAGGSAPAASGKDTGSKPDKDSKDNAKNRPIRTRRPAPRARASSTICSGLAIASDSWMRIFAGSGDQGIEAVGVLGSDLYDKLLCCRRCDRCCRMPGSSPPISMPCCCIPSAQNATRNLLVASGFGLRLRPDVQGAIPPFRSNYQTAEFLAARVAIRSAQRAQTDVG